MRRVLECWEGKLMTDMFDIKGDNFLGTGMSLQDFMVKHRVEQFTRSWFAQDRIEQTRRLELVIRLSVELVKIRDVNIFATGLGESSIKAVIEGEWRELIGWIVHLKFSSESDDIQQDFQPLWADFVKILEEAYAGRPQEHHSNTKH